MPEIATSGKALLAMTSQFKIHYLEIWLQIRILNLYAIACGLRATPLSLRGCRGHSRKCPRRPFAPLLGRVQKRELSAFSQAFWRQKASYCKRKKFYDKNSLD